VHSIDSDGGGPPDNWDKTHQNPRIKHKIRPSTRDSVNIAKGADQWAGATVAVCNTPNFHYRLFLVLYSASS
jgi:hypothetical protein